MLGTAVLLCGIYAWFFGFNTMVILEMRQISRKFPVVRQTPRNLSDQTVSNAPGTKLSCFGYEFEVPWADLDAAQTKSLKNGVVIFSRGGNGLMFKSLPPREFINALPNKGQLRQLNGEAPLQSDYSTWRLIVDATPDKVTLFSSRRETINTSMLVLIKAVATPEKSGLFLIQNKDFKGFQWGDPQYPPRRVVADLFADDGGLELIFLRRKDATAPPLSQAGINRVLQTVRRIADLPKPAKSTSGL
jgi:hypothetical protein